MARFRKKPIEVEATQWFPGLEVPGVRKGLAAELRSKFDGPYYVVTIHGQSAYLAPGDWVITEPDGIHHYPCKPDIFAATYEPAD